MNHLEEWKDLPWNEWWLRFPEAEISTVYFFSSKFKTIFEQLAVYCMYKIINEYKCLKLSLLNVFAGVRSNGPYVRYGPYILVFPPKNAEEEINPQRAAGTCFRVSHRNYSSC